MNRKMTSFIPRIIIHENEQIVAMAEGFVPFPSVFSLLPALFSAPLRGKHLSRYECYFYVEALCHL